MRYEKWKRLLGGMLVLLIASTHVYADGSLAQTHQNWGSRVVHKDGVVAFRALTTYTESRTTVVLTIDRYPDECSSQYISMNVVLPDPAQQTFDSKPLFGALRIDETAIRDINYKLSATAGESVAFVTITNFDKEETLLEEFIKGRTLRFKLGLAKGEIYLRFSLLGFTAAATRSLELCGQFAKGKPDQEYSNKDLKVKGDKSYF
jgi:hypothetical protein